MKEATPELRELIEGGVFCRADLYTITLVSSEIIRCTSADINLSWDGNLFLSDRPPLVRQSISTSLGLEVDSLKLDAFPTPDDLVSGLPFGQAVRSGLLDAARVLLEKAYMPNWSSPIVGVLHGFEGRVSDMEGGRTGYSIDVKSEVELFDIDMPKNLYQSTCLHTVYDPGCTLIRASFTVAGTINGVPTLSSFTTTSNSDKATGYFDQGVLAFTSGVNNGVRRTIKSHVNASGTSTFTFALPLRTAPTAGDTFTMYPGCNRTQAICSSKFSNLAHFKGYPYVPTPETVY